MQSSIDKDTAGTFWLTESKWEKMEHNVNYIKKEIKPAFLIYSNTCSISSH